MLQGLKSILSPYLLDDLISIVTTYAAFKGIEVLILEGHNDGVTCLTALPETSGVGKVRPNVAQLASGSRDRTIRMWNLSTGMSQVLEGHINWVTSLVVLPEETGMRLDRLNVTNVGGQLTSGSYDRTIRIWDLFTGTSQVLKGYTDDVACLAVLPEVTKMDFRHSNVGTVIGGLASGSFDKTIRIWDLSTGKNQVLTGHIDRITSLAVLPNSRLASGSYDGTIRIWDLSTGMSQVLKGHTDNITCLTVLPDGRLASGSYDKTIRIWV